MNNSASDRLTKLNDRIMNTWEKRAIEEVQASIHQDSLALRDSLPEFLQLIAKALSTTVNRTDAKVRWDKSESTRVGKKHGRERATAVNYTMDQLIFEYHILRQVICELMEEEAPLSAVEREVIVCAVEQAVNDAATEFNDILCAVQETYTSTLAHDLRGPITSSKLSVQLLLKKPHDSDLSRKIASRVANCMDRLDFMIHDLLDASRLRAGEPIEIGLAICDLDIILSEIADDTNFLQGNRIVLKSEGPVVGQWNEEGIKRITDNLISNALKFSFPDTPITLEVKKNETEVEISVHNLGDPIEETEKPLLFQAFRRVKTGHGKSGWGLGLSVVEGLAKAHGGHVDVQSTLKDGTIFKVILPLNPDTILNQ